MKSLKLQIELVTPCIIGSGTGYGSLIDTDIVFDEVGLPLIPSKRIKGCLRDSALDLIEAFKCAGISLFDNSHINRAFGAPGQKEPAEVYFSNLAIEGYEEANRYLKELFAKENEGLIVNRETVLSYFTEVRQQTAIEKENGVAKEHSLRTMRVLKKGLTFSGNIDLVNEDSEIEKVLFFASRNLRHIGTNRTRGFGFINCKLIDIHKNKELDYLHELEALCNR